MKFIAFPKCSEQKLFIVLKINSRIGERTKFKINLNTFIW